MNPLYFLGHAVRLDLHSRCFAGQRIDHAARVVQGTRATSPSSYKASGAPIHKVCAAHAARPSRRRAHLRPLAQAHARAS